MEKIHLFFFGTPKENRTPDSAVRGRRLNRLTMRACIKLLSYYKSSLLLFRRDNSAINRYVGLCQSKKVRHKASELLIPLVERAAS